MLSVRGASAWVERRCRVYHRQGEEDLVRELQRFGLSELQARDAVRLSLVRGRVVRRTHDGVAVLQAPADWRSA